MNTKSLRQKLLDLAIRGKLVPQNPNDEPASTLLHHINPQIKPITEDTPFDIPESWAWTTLGEISNYGKCINIKVSEINPNDWVLELEEIEKDSGLIIQTIHKSERNIKGVRHPFNKGQILYSKLRTYLNKVLVADSAGYCTTEIIPFDVKDNIFPNYICHVLRSRYFLDYTMSCGYGVKMPRLSTKDARKGLVPLPPLTEQKRIVKEIERWFAYIDTIEQSKEALLEAMKSMRSKFLSLAIQGKLVPQDPNDEPAIELLHRINPSFVPPQYDEPLPQGWTPCKYKDIFINISSGPFQVLQSQIQKTGKYPVVSQSAKYIEGYSNVDCVLKHDKPYIIFGDHTKVVKYVDFDFVIGADGVKVINPLINEKYAYYLIMYAAIRIEDRGYARHFSLISKYMYLIPPLAEQKRIVARIEELFAILDKIQESVD